MERQNRVAVPAGQVEQGELPKEVFGWKYVEKLTGKPTPLKDQNPTGSCVGFGTVNAIEKTEAAEIVAEADLAPADIPLASLPATALRLRGELLGKEVQRALIAGRPVLAASVREPRAVRRGDQVLIAFSGDGIDLTAPGRALQDGILGDQVRVVNLASNRTITAAVAGSGRVTVE